MVEAAARPHPGSMDFDLDLLDRKPSHRSDRRRHLGDHRRDRRRRAHPHVLAWLVRAGGAVLLGLVAIAVASALGVWGHVADVYFAATRAVLPASWHDEWTALPGIAHVALGLGALFIVIGLASEVLD